LKIQLTMTGSELMQTQKARRLHMAARLALLLQSIVLVVSCGGGSGNPAPAGGSNAIASSAAWITGNWLISLQKSSGITKAAVQSGFLLASSNSISGSVLIDDPTCPGVGDVSGAVKASSLEMSVAAGGQTISLSGASGSDKTSMAGNYVTLATGCGTSETGSWIATLVPPLNGNFQGVFTSNSTGVVAPVSGQVSQAQNAIGANAALAGNLTATGSSCIAAANISGVVSGTTVVWNLLNSSGTQIGQASGAMNIPGDNGIASIQGTYRILPLPRPQPAHTPCVSGETGTLCVTTGASAAACTTTQLSSSENPANQQDEVTLTATVTGTATMVPTGSVTFRDGISALGSGPVALANGLATLTTSTLAAGPTHLITAVYSGDANSAASTSDVLGQAVNSSAQ